MIPFFQFLFSASASRYWSECGCTWDPVLPARVEKAHLSEVGDELPRRKGKVCRGSVLAGSWPVYRWLQEQKHPPWVPCHTAVLWRDAPSILVSLELGASCPVLLLDNTICQTDSVVAAVLRRARREESASACSYSLGFLWFLGRRCWWWVPPCH